MAGTENEARVKTLWLISNILANSEAEALCVAESGILANVRIACHDEDSKVRDEALWTMGSVIVCLKDPQRLKQTVKQFELDKVFLNILRDQTSPPRR